jgi:hypothetical protein
MVQPSVLIWHAAVCLNLYKALTQILVSWHGAVINVIVAYPQSLMWLKMRSDLVTKHRQDDEKGLAHREGRTRSLQIPT